MNTKILSGGAIPAQRANGGGLGSGGSFPCSSPSLGESASTYYDADGAALSIGDMVLYGVALYVIESFSPPHAVCVPAKYRLSQSLRLPLSAVQRVA
jgi:hypothetical protein